MPNIVVDQAKLVLNAFAATFQNNLVSKDLVTWKKYDSEMNDRNALTVVEQVEPRYSVTRTTSGVQDLTAGVQDTVFGSEQFKVQDVFGSSMGWGDFVKITSLDEARESIAIAAAAQRLAEVIDSYIMSTVVLASNNWTGVPGNSVDTIDDFTTGYVRLKNNGVADSDLRAVLTYGDQAALATNVVSLPALSDIASDTYRNGWTGQIGGIPTMFTQQLPVITTGTRTSTAAVNGAAQNVNYSAVAISPAPGQYLTQLLSINGLSGTQTVLDGEVFTIAGIFDYDNRASAVKDNLQQFRVIGNYAATAGAIANMRVFPAIVVPGTGTGGDILVNNAQATCSAVPGSTAVITFVGSPSTAYRPRLLVHKNAVQVNTCDLILPATGIGMRKSLTKVPLSVRMWKNSNFNTGEHDVRFDVVLTANTRDRRYITRMSGN